VFEQFFGLSENPFNVTPDPRFLFLSKAHDEALSYLRYGIDQRKGFILITGEVGAGKTTICRALLAGLPKTVKTALILNPALSAVELLQAINQDFGIDASSTSKKALLDELYDFLIKTFVNGENAVLIIDECQNLEPEVLEQIRMLSNLETEKEKLLQIVLVGQPELVKILSAPAMKQIDDRIVLRYHIWPLTLWDTRSYINHRLVISGSHGDIKFTSLAMRFIHRHSGGIPRRINALAERCLLMAYLRTTRKITLPIVLSAVRELKGNYPSRRLRPALAAAALAVFAAGAFAAWQVMPGIIQGRGEGVGSEVVKERDIKAVLPDGALGTGAAQTAGGAPVRDVRGWIIPEYDAALDALGRLPSGLYGPDSMNLHPRPEYLRYCPAPSVVSVEGGYVVMLEAGEDFVRVVGADKAVIEIPMEDFQRLYRWNVMVPYARPLHPEYLSAGRSGPVVEEVQKVLLGLGLVDIEPDGLYGPETVQAVERFQELMGLKRDGIVGPETLILLRNIGGGPR